jgi:hypothetical protein
MSDKQKHQAEEAMHNSQAEALKKRMKHVIEDANIVLSHLIDGKPLDGITDYGVRIHTHLDNITIACELDNDEYETWKD